jgi:hypothetical protein
MVVKVIYSEDGVAVADQQSLAFAESFWKSACNQGNDLRLRTSSYNVVLAFRLLVKRGTIPASRILFYHREEDQYPIRVNKDGELSEYPKGFCDTYSNLILELI